MSLKEMPCVDFWPPQVTAQMRVTSHNSYQTHPYKCIHMHTHIHGRSTLSSAEFQTPQDVLGVPFDSGIFDHTSGATTAK